MSIGRHVDVHCDGCGTNTRTFDNAKQARARARMLGWRRTPLRRIERPESIEVRRRLDLCPRCFVTAGRP